MEQKNPKTPRSFVYRLSQIMGFLLGARFFVTVLLTLALYVSTFFLFNREENFRTFVFDYHVHLIIFCAILSILAGGIINQFYDREKDKITQPFRSQLQSFLKQKYFLYMYVTLNLISLSVAATLSWRVFIFFLFYQFFMWFYSHKLSKILIINNLSFVLITMYPFFGMLVYYKTFTLKIFFMAIFLFLILMIVDMVKDLLTKNADKVFGYHTIANTYPSKTARYIIIFTTIICILISIIITKGIGLESIMGWYFFIGLFVLIFAIFLLFRNRKNDKYICLTTLRMWVLMGIFAMLLDGINHKYNWIM